MTRDEMLLQNREIFSDSQSAEVLPNLVDPAFWALPRDDRHEGYDALRKAGPVVWTNDPSDEKRGGFWAVLSHAGCKAVEKSPEIYSNRAGGVRITDMPAEFLDKFGNMIHMDPPEHTKLRRLTARAFMPATLKNIDESIVETASMLVTDACANGAEFDFIEQIAAPFPLRIICSMMCVPEERFPEIFRLTNAFLGAEDPALRLEQHQTAQQSRQTAAAELTAILDDILDGGGIVTGMLEVLMSPDRDGNCLSRDELRRYFLLLIAAGTEAARQALGHGLLLLEANPDQAAEWKANPEKLTKTAVEEILRMSSTTIHMRRTALIDTSLEGTEIAADDKVVIYYQAANRDPTVFENPQRFDIHRSFNPHFAFGAYGPHHCLGAALARRELSAMFQAIFDQMPNLEIIGEPEFMMSDFIDGIKSLNVRV